MKEKKKKKTRQPRGFVVNEKQFVFSIYHDKLGFSPQITELGSVQAREWHSIKRQNYY